jgi:two-component system OmpR family sensor kinase
VSLANRLSLYFLAALGVILVSFSLTLYLLAHRHLYSQFDERLTATMNALVAAIEIHADNVQWEPDERRIVVGEDSAIDQPRWSIHDEAGQLKDRSNNLTHEASSMANEFGWRVIERHMEAGNFQSIASDGKLGVFRVDHLKQTLLSDVSAASLPVERTFRSAGLTLTVAASEAPVVAMLRWLAFVLVGVSLTIWVTAALWGRWLCRSALRPISQMAVSARSIRTKPDAKQKLEVPETRDELEDLGQAFNELLTDLRESFERQRRFTGDASHQLRTPLTAMLASVDVVLRHDRPSAEYQKVLQLIKRRGGQLSQILESLLFLARADGASLLADPELIDLNEWCGAWIEDVWNEHPRASDFKLLVSADKMMISTHPALLGQVVDNVLDNACKYSEAGTPIEIRVESNSNYACVSVNDSGSGIPQDQQSLIFEPFYRSQEARWQGKPGVGLGLTVVQRLVEFLHAKMEVLSEPGKGSHFRILIPIDAKHRQNDSSPSTQASIPQTG